MTLMMSLLTHCRKCGRVFPQQRAKAHGLMCSGGPEMQFPATQDQVDAYDAARLAESVEQERIAAGPVPPPPRRRRHRGRNTSGIAAGA